MLRVTTAQARPGMMLALPVHHPRHHDVLLLRAGVGLDRYAIPRLREMGVPEVWIAQPGLEDLVRFVDPQVLASYRQLTSAVGVALDAAMVQSRVELEYCDYKRAVMSVLNRLIDNPTAALMVTELVGGDRPFVRHAGNVTILSLLMGLKLEFYLVRERPKLSPSLARELSGLGVGAIFHDVGMTRLAPEVLARWNATQDERDEEWRRHAQLGYEMVRGDLEPAAAAIVLNHHQRYDGSGWPQKGSGKLACPQKGSMIHIFARIVACADLYDRLRNPAHAPGSDEQATPSIPGVRALNMMRRPMYRKWVDPVVFLGLLSIAPPYPPGSLVTLSDGRRGVVTDWSAASPCRPTVDILELGSEGKEPRVRVDLRRASGLSVAGIDGHDVSKDNFEPAFEGELDLARVGKVMQGGGIVKAA